MIILLLVAMPGAPSSFLFLVVRPGAPSSVFAPTSKNQGVEVLKHWGSHMFADFVSG